MTRRQFAVDVETTALTPSYADGRGVAWEVAAVERCPDGSRPEHLWRMEPPNLPAAEIEALTVSGYYERTRKMRHRDQLAHDLAGTPAARAVYWSHPPALAVDLARLLNGATLIAVNPGFDAGFLAAFLRHHGQAPTWSYRLRDFGSMAYGYLSACQALGTEGRDCALGRPDMDSGGHDFARALGVSPEAYELHTALGDARLLSACLDVIERRTP